MRIEVENQHESGQEIPRTFCLNGHQIDVVEILDQWFGTDYRYCKVKGRDDGLYILRFDELRLEWHLTMFASARAQAATAQSSRQAHPLRVAM